MSSNVFHGKMKYVPLVYLDLCLVKRFWDDRSILRNRLEFEVLLDILKLWEEGAIRLVNSAALEAENAKNPDFERREGAARILSAMNLYIDAVVEDFKRQNELVSFGFGEIDALHLALAEKAGAGMFITADDALIITVKKKQELLKLKALSALDWQGVVKGVIK